jgi:hypothetical protein
LKGAPELNGKGGTVEQWDGDKGRWNVRLPGGELKALKPENLSPKKTDIAAMVPWVIGVVLVALVLQQSGVFDVASPVGYVRELFEPFDPPPPKAPADTVVISFCQG